MNYVTSSLINAWLYLLNSPYATVESFLDTLNKVRFDPTPQMQAGIDFEQEVYEGKHETYNPYIKDALYQVRIWGTCNGIGISGIIDFLQPNVIIDVKHTKHYEVGKYYNTSQHIFYPYVTGIKHFKYMVNPECYVEEYWYKEGQAEKLINDFIEWLKVAGYYEIWKSKWYKEERTTNGN